MEIQAPEPQVALPFAPVVRRIQLDDMGFIFSTWLKHYKQHSAITKNISNSVYYAKQHRIIERILARSLTVVAHPPEQPAVILGYAVLEMARPNIIHWVYVKGPWRRFGIAKALLGGLDYTHCSFSHWTHDIDPFRNRWPQAVYDPFLAAPL